MFPADEEVTRQLFLAEEPETADLAIVFGSADDDEAFRRVRRAAELYHAGLVPRLLLTGGDPARRGQSEAERMAEVAAAAGVPVAALALETQSRTTWENALLCRQWLERQGLLAGLAGQAGLRTVLLVSAAWHLRRARLIVQAVFQAEVRIRWVCVASRGGCEADTWTSRPEWRGLVEVEWWLLHEAASRQR
jgi:uncharacterized SAM-binding protein YcdF (DUF218 family)